MLKKALFIFCLVLSVYGLTGQNILTEIQGAGKAIEDLRGFSRGDSIFITYYDKAHSNSVTTSNDFQTIWVLPDGTQKKTNLRSLERKSFIGATKQNDTSFYYYLDEVKKKIQLKVLGQIDKSDTTNTYDLGVSFTGKLLVSFIENDFLYLLVAEKDELRLTKIKSLKTISTTAFSILPLDLSKDKKKQFNFVHNRRISQPAQAANLSKVIRSSNDLFVVVDDPAGYRNEQLPSYKTAVIKLDLINGTVITKYFFEKSPSDFRTTVYGNKVLRYTDGKSPEITIYDYLSGTVLKKQLTPVPDVRDSLFFRSGKYSNSIMQPLVGPRAFICVDSIDSDLILTVGIEALHEPATIIPVPVLGFYAPVMIGDLNGFREYYFYCLRGDVNSGFQKTTAAMLPNQKIHHYELTRKEEVKFKHKLYVSNTKRIFAIYNEGKNTNLKILKFER